MNSNQWYLLSLFLGLGVILIGLQYTDVNAQTIKSYDNESIQVIDGGIKMPEFKNDLNCLKNEKHISNKEVK